MTKNLIIIETAAQVKALAEAGIFCRPGISNLVISAEAALACQERGYTYIKMEDFVSVTDRRIEYAPIVEKFLEWQKSLDSFVQRSVPEFFESGFMPARNSSYPFQMIHGELWAFYVNFTEFLERFDCKSIWYWSPIIENFPPHLFPDISLIPIVAPCVAQSRSIKTTDLCRSYPLQRPSLNWVGNNRSKLKAIKSILGRSVTFRDLYNGDFYNICFRLRNLIGAKAHVLCAGMGYDIEPLAADMRRLGANIHFCQINWDDSADARSIVRNYPMPESARSFWDDLVHSQRLWSIFEELGIGKLEIWLEALRAWWHGVVPQQWYTFNRVLSLLQRKKIDLVLGWDFSGITLGATVANAARISGIPLFGYQHGGSCHTSVGLQCHAELQYSDFYLTYGPATGDTFLGTMPKSLKRRPCVLPVGSQRLINLLKKTSETRKANLVADLKGNDSRPVILYIPTRFGGIKGMNTLADYPDVSYLEWQQRILRLCAQFHGIRLLYKGFSYQSNIMRSFIAEHVQNAEVTSLHITELMWAVDAIIIDHTITAIGEILLTNKPIVAFMPKDEFSATDAARELLSKRAYVADTVSDFEVKIRLLIERSEFHELENPNTEFLEAYCIGKESQVSGAIAARSVLKYAHEWKTQNDLM